MEPAIRYAMNGDVAIAYEAVGDGPVDLLYLAPINNLEIVWENPYFARFVRRLTDFARVILMDRRGTGLSDRFSPNDLPPIEDLADDILCVLDAVGSKRTVLFGYSDAGDDPGARESPRADSRSREPRGVGRRVCFAAGPLVEVLKAGSPKTI